MSFFKKSKNKNSVSKDQISEKDILIIVACSIGFFFFSLFIYIEKLPFDFVFFLYGVLTSVVLKWMLVSMSPFVVYLAITERNIGFPLVLLALMGGQYMFVHHFADSYSLPFEKNKVEKKGRHMYFPHQNIG